MGIPRKLTSEQERQVALAYFCGVDTEYLGQCFTVSDATIRSNIIGKRSKEWDDPLVELYRQSGVRGRERNSAHLFLSFQENVSEIKPSGLIKCLRDDPVYQTIDYIIYVPQIEEIIQRTALREYTALQGPYDKFLQTLKRYPGEEYSMVRDLFINSLKGAYNEYQSSNTPFSLDQVSTKVRETIVDKVKNGGLMWSKLKKQAVHTELETLFDQERQVLGTLYGLDGYNGPKDLEKMAFTFWIDKKRIRQIEAKAIRKLRGRSSCYKNLKFLFGLTTDADLEAHAEKVRCQQERANWKTTLYSEIKEEVLARKDEISSSDALHRSIYELELSVRAYNCLKNSDIKTVGELATKTESELLRTRNFGHKTLKEIKELLAEMGLKLGMTISQDEEKESNVLC